MATPLLHEDRLQRGAPEFLAGVLAANDTSGLRKLSARWGKDTRPFARQALLAYVDDGCDRIGHRFLVKRLFKDAEERQDDELMAHFAAAFDRLDLPRMVPTRTWSRAAGGMVDGVVLTRPVRNLKGRFSRRTRQYLQRRVARYLDRLPDDRYVPALCTFLRALPADLFQQPEAVLGAFTLLNVLFGRGSTLERRPRGFALRGRLADLVLAPRRPALFTPELGAALIDAPNPLVRAQARALLAAGPPLALDLLLRWLSSPYADLHHFALSQITRSRGLETLPLDTWLRLLAHPDPEVLDWAAGAFLSAVQPARLSTDRCLALAAGRSRRIAEAAWGWLLGRDPSPEQVGGLLHAPHPTVQAAAAGWLQERARRTQDALDARDLLDGPTPAVRATGLALLDEAPFADSALLWAAMAESPYADVQDRLTPHLEARRDLLPAGAPAAAWARALFRVDRGAAAKQQTLRQLRERLQLVPEEASALLPLFGVALRSSRPREQRAAAAQLARLASASPALSPAIRRAFPELQLFPEEG